jgi:hypothetical protein
MITAAPTAAPTAPVEKWGISRSFSPIIAGDAPEARDA